MPSLFVASSPRFRVHTHTHTHRLDAQSNCLLEFRRNCSSMWFWRVVFSLFSKSMDLIYEATPSWWLGI